MLMEPMHGRAASRRPPPMSGLVGHQNSSFYRFNQWYQHALCISSRRCELEDFAFPCEPPFCQKELAGSAEHHSPRQRRRWRRRRFAMRWVNDLFSFYSWNALGCPKAVDQYVPENRWFSGVCVRAHGLELVSEVANFSCSGAGLSKTSLDGNRKQLQNSIHSFSMHDYERQQQHNFNTKPHSNIDQLTTNAIYVDPDRIGIPERAGLVDPLSYLPPHERAVVRDLRRLKLPEEEWGPIAFGLTGTLVWVCSCKHVTTVNRAGTAGNRQIVRRQGYLFSCSLGFLQVIVLPHCYQVSARQLRR